MINFIFFFDGEEFFGNDFSHMGSLIYDGHKIVIKH